MCIETRVKVSKRINGTIIEPKKPKLYIIYGPIHPTSIPIIFFDTDSSGRAFTSYLIVFKTISVDLTFACQIASFQICQIWYTRQLRAVPKTFFFIEDILHFFAAKLLSEDIRTLDPSHDKTASKHVLLNLHAKNRWLIDSFSSPQSGQDSFWVAPSLNRRSLVLSLFRKASQRMNLVLGKACVD